MGNDVEEMKGIKRFARVAHKILLKIMYSRVEYFCEESSNWSYGKAAHAQVMFHIEVGDCRQMGSAQVRFVFFLYILALNRTKSLTHFSQLNMTR